MFSDFIMDAMCGDELLYECYEFRGHLFRRYPDGKLCAADEADEEGANYMREWSRKLDLERGARNK